MVDFTKDEMVNALAIIMDIKPADKPGLAKMNLNTLRSVYEGILRNLESHKTLQDKLLDTENQLRIAQARIKYLEKKTNAK